MSKLSRGERLLNRLQIIGNDLLDHGEGALETTEEIMRGAGSNISRFFKGMSNTIIGSLDTGESVGTLGDSLDYLSKGEFSKSATALGDSIYYGIKGTLGTTAGVTQTASSLLPAALLGTGGALAYGVYRAIKNSTVGKAIQGDFDDLADDLFEKVKTKTSEGLSTGVEKLKKIKKSAYENYRKKKKNESKIKEVPELVGEAEVLME